MLVLLNQRCGDQYGIRIHPDRFLPHPFSFEVGKGRSRDFFCIFYVRNSDLRVLENPAGVWSLTHLGLQFCFTCVPPVRLKHARLIGTLHVLTGVSLKLLPDRLNQDNHSIVGVVVQVQIREPVLGAPAENNVPVGGVGDKCPPSLWLL